MKRILFAVSAFLTVAPAWSLSDDSCRDRNGLAINSEECITFRKENRGLSDIDCFRSMECRQQKESAALVRRERQEQTKAAEQEEIERAELASTRRLSIAESARRKECGGDYKVPRIGMALERVAKCVAALRLTGQINRADGVVSTYEGAGGYFHVMNGVVVSWGRY